MWSRVLTQIRLVVPDRPGSLGLVASAIGAAGADVEQVDVLASEQGRATDDLRIRVDGERHLARLVSSLKAIPGVVVQAVRCPVAPESGHGDLELIRTVMQAGTMQVLVDQAVGSLEMDWVAVCSVAGPAQCEVVASSALGPVVGTVIEHPVRLGVIPGGVITLLVPMGTTVLLLSRTGMDFHPIEVNRMAEVGKVLGGILSQQGAGRTGATVTS